jgi:glycosyltransferase involved in cell wall biosynthesis
MAEAMTERVAYVLKGWPRISELFIASEIQRLEALGVPLGLYVIKQADESVQHDVVTRITAPVRRLPVVGSLSSTSLLGWLRRNLRPFLGPLARVARRHPLGLLRAGADALAQSVRARKGWWPRKIYTKELLQAVALADLIDADGGARHLHAHFAHGTTTVAWFASTILGVEFSFTGHAKDIYKESLNPAGLLHRKLDLARFVATCTCANVEHLRAIHPGANIQLVHHGLNADFSRLLADAPPHRPPEHFRIVSVGRQVPKKGFDVLIDAVALLAARGLDVELVIAGEDGPEHAALAERAQAAGITERVQFAGTVTQAELLALYRGASAFSLACRIDDTGDRDGIPNVLVEAMASGLPVVSTAVSGIPEAITDGVNGLLVQPEQPGELAAALERLAHDAGLASKLGHGAASTVAEHFDGDRLAATMASLLTGQPR